MNNHVEFNKNPNTIFFKFNNSARLCKPNKKKLVSIYYNNSLINQDKFIKKILKKYNNCLEEENKILLINSWNEWGEDMAIEPGKISGYKYLELIKSNLISFITNN